MLKKVIKEKPKEWRHRVGKCFYGALKCHDGNGSDRFMFR